MAQALRPHRFLADAVLLTMGLGCCYVFGFAAPLAARLGRTDPDDAINLGLVALAIGAAAFAFEALRLMLRIRLRSVTLWKGRHQERGSIIVEFALLFPLLLWLISMVFQMALFANASFVAKYAAYAAARSAAVSTEWQLGLPPRETVSSQGQADARLAAHLVLASISPWNDRNDSNPAGNAMRDTVGRQGSLYLNRTYPHRIDYAQRNSHIEFETKSPPVNPLASAAASVLLPSGMMGAMNNPIGNREVLVKIDYNLYLVIPGIDFLPGMPVVRTTVRGQPARAIVIKAAHQIPTTGPREAHPLQATWLGWFPTAF